MDTNQAIEILSALGTGCDPETGELLDADSVLCRTDVLQALFVAIGVLKKSTSESKSPTLLTVNEAAQKTLGVTVKGGPQRFNQRGWFSVGETIVSCPTCNSTLHGFRKPYVSGGNTYHYWALACAKCRSGFEPSVLPDEARQALYNSSELKPGSKEKTVNKQK